MPPVTVWVVDEEDFGFDLYATRDAALDAARRMAVDRDATQVSPTRWESEEGGSIFVYENVVHAAPPHPLPV